MALTKILHRCLTGRTAYHLVTRNYCMLSKFHQNPRTYLNCQSLLISHSKHRSARHSSTSISEQPHSPPKVTIENGGLAIALQDQKRLLNFLWLRDNCHCHHCYNHPTFQKKIKVNELPDYPYPESVNLSGSDSLEIVWSDKHRSDYSVDWLLAHSYPGSKPINDKLLWTGSSIQEVNVKMVPHDDYMASEKGVKSLVYNLLKYGFGIVKGAPATMEGTQAVAERLCIIQNTMFGDMWAFQADEARGDTAYTSLALGAHNDTTYFSNPCGIQIFHCVHHDGEGGKTRLVDGFYAAETLRKNNPEYFDILTKTKIVHEYIEACGTDHKSLDSILKIHPVSQELEWIRYNHYDRGPISTVPQEQVPHFYKALSALTELIEAPSADHWIKLLPGSVLFVDNWRVLHGRSSFTGNRKVTGCYLPRDEWLAKARKLKLL